MPVRVEQIPKGQSYAGQYRVVDAQGKLHASHTTKAKAEAQARLLNEKAKKQGR